jgi:hypothetical protein
MKILDTKVGKEAKRNMEHESTGQVNPSIHQAFQTNESAYHIIAAPNAAVQKTTIQGESHEAQRFID